MDDYGKISYANSRKMLDWAAAAREKIMAAAEQCEHYPFKVQVRIEWFDGEKMKKSDTHYIVAAKDVGQAKERIARLLDIFKAEREKDGAKDDPNTTRTIRKAMPFEVDCIVPKEFSDMFYEEPTKI